MENENRIRSRSEFDYSVLSFRSYDKMGNLKPSFLTKVNVADISYSGIGILSDVKLEIGELLVINICYKGSDVLEYKGEIKWCDYQENQYHSGLAFMELTREHIELLDRIIKQKKGI